MAIELTSEEFKAKIKESDVPVLIDFWAPWCGPCRMLGPIIDQVAEEAGDKAVVAKMNVDDCQDVAGKYSITSVPTVIIFENGEVKEQLVGVQPKPKYLSALGL